MRGTRGGRHANECFSLVCVYVCAWRGKTIKAGTQPTPNIRTLTRFPIVCSTFPPAKRGVSVPKPTDSRLPSHAYDRWRSVATRGKTIRFGPLPPHGPQSSPPIVTSQRSGVVQSISWDAIRRHFLSAEDHPRPGGRVYSTLHSFFSFDVA